MRDHLIMLQVRRKKRNKENKVKRKTKKKKTELYINGKNEKDRIFNVALFVLFVKSYKYILKKKRNKH